jgi:hypothetical protein
MARDSSGKLQTLVTQYTTQTMPSRNPSLNIYDLCSGVVFGKNIF